MGGGVSMKEWLSCLFSIFVDAFRNWMDQNTLSAVRISIKCDIVTTGCQLPAKFDPK